MACKDTEFLKEDGMDPVELYTAWSGSETYSLNFFCLLVLMLDFPLIRNYKLDNQR